MNDGSPQRVRHVRAITPLSTTSVARPYSAEPSFTDGVVHEFVHDPSCIICNSDLRPRVDELSIRLNFSANHIWGALAPEAQEIFSRAALKKHVSSHSPGRGAIKRALLTHHAEKNGVDWDGATSVVVDAVTLLETLYNIGFQDISRPGFEITVSEAIAAAGMAERIKKEAGVGSADAAVHSAALQRFVEIAQDRLGEKEFVDLIEVMRSDKILNALVAKSKQIENDQTS